MSIIDGLTHGFARLMRSTPNFKGRGRLIRVFNRSMLAAAVEPLVTAPMNEGTRMRVDLRSGTEFSSFYTGAYARDRLKELKAVMSTSTSGVFLDVGANIGFYTVAMARQLAAREDNRQFHRVIAFEPVPANYLRLKENLDLNHLGDLVRVYGHGLSDHKGEATITLREDFVAGSATGNAALSTSPERDAGFATAQVPLRRFDDLAPEFASSQHPIVAIKLDIEGHEDAFLRGGGGSLKSHRPLVLMEVNRGYYQARGVKLNDVFLPAIPDGYHIYALRGGRWRKIDSFDGCKYLEDIYLVPIEKKINYAFLRR